MKRQIVNETPEDKKKRKQEASRKSTAAHRARETPEATKTRLAKNRESTKRRRDNATALETEARLETERIRSQTNTHAFPSTTRFLARRGQGLLGMFGCLYVCV